MLEHGLIQVYTSKTSCFNFAPYGLALRAAGQGLRICVLYFSSPMLLDIIRGMLQMLDPDIVLKDLSRPGTETDAHIASVSEILSDGNCDLVICEGIHPFLRKRRSFREDLLRLCKTKSPHTEWVLTGPDAPPEMIEAADLVTEMHLKDRTVHRKEAMDLPPGRTVVVTGDGKGKTTYCLGLGALMSSRGTDTRMIQYVKSARPYGEIKGVSMFPRFNIVSMGKGMIGGDAEMAEPKHYLAAQEAWALSKKAAEALKSGILILDEINIATRYEWISIGQVEAIMRRKADAAELLFSGRDAAEEIENAADRVVEMKKIKHPFDRGIKARKGIEF